MEGGGEAKSGSRRKLLRGVSTNVIILGVVSLLTDLSTEMIIPILPMFLLSVGATGLLIGVIEGAAETTASLLKVVSGWYSDRVRRRKPFILGGYGSSALAKPLLILAASPWHVLGIRVTERIGKGVRSAPRDALIADSTRPESMGIAFGFHKSMDSFGALLGVLALIAVVFAIGADLDVGLEEDDYRVVFAVAAAPALVAVLVIALFVRDVRAGEKPRRRSFVSGMKDLGRPFRLLMVVVMIFYIAEINVAFFLLKGLDEGFSDLVVILFYALFNLTFFAMPVMFGSLSDRMGRRPVIMSSFALYVVTCLIMAVAGDWWMLVLGFTMLGVYKAASEGVFKAYVVDVVPEDLRGAALGAFHTGIGLVMLPGGIIAGLLYDSLGPTPMFLYGAVLALVSMGLLFALGPKDRGCPSVGGSA
ncbi:TPA: MFS transporter [Thermoplasmata archaeon]|nr:MFS transporter [Thermoplasmata archaeon]